MKLQAKTEKYNVMCLFLLEREPFCHSSHILTSIWKTRDGVSVAIIGLHCYCYVLYSSVPHLKTWDKMLNVTVINREISADLS